MDLSNVEFVLLQILSENKEVSGYKINKIVSERGYKEWASIGTTSIYNGLKKMAKKKFVKSRIASEKEGRGAVPRMFEITNPGRNFLRNEVLSAIIDPKCGFARFSLALGNIFILKKEDILISLKKRKVVLLEDLTHLRDKMDLQGGSKLPFNVKKIFDYSLWNIEKEADFTDKLIEDMKEYYKQNDHSLVVRPEAKMKTKGKNWRKIF